MTKPWVGASVLVVDDSEKIRKKLSESLTELGLNVIKTAEDGVQALDFLKTTSVDIVTIDVIMPVMHGVELYREIKKRFPAQKAFFVTLLAREKKFIDAYKDEIPEELFQGKPFTKQELEQKLNFLYDLQLLTGGSDIMESEADIHSAAEQL